MFLLIIKKGTPKSSLVLYQPIAGAVKATGVVAAVARSKGKLCAFLNFPYNYLILLSGLDYIITISGVGRLFLLLRELYPSGSL